MLACVCQPADAGVFRRSQPLLSGTMPKPGRAVAMTPAVITSEPGARSSRSVMEKFAANNEPADNASSSSELVTKSKRTNDGVSKDVMRQNEVGAESSSQRGGRNREEFAKKSKNCDKVWLMLHDLLAKSKKINVFLTAAPSVTSVFFSKHCLQK